MNRSSYKLTDSLIFIAITCIFLFTRLLTFKGFNGTDDLHYALLSSHILQGRFNPFIPDDIWSGRVLLLLWQSFIYHVAGINTFSTQIGTTLCSVFCCYLTIFRLSSSPGPAKIILAASIFYFSPVLTNASLGILPDPM